MNELIKHIVISVIVFQSCVNTPSGVKLTDDVRSIAFPLVETAINVTDFEHEDTNNSISVSTDDDGRVTVTYKGEVVNRDWSIISPPLPVVAFTFVDSIHNIVLNKPTGGNLLVDEIINRIEFTEWNIRFQISHSYKEDVVCKIKMPQIVKNGQAFECSFHLSYQGNDKYETETFSLEGYHFESTNNQFVLEYDARLASGERVLFHESLGLFLPFNPSYVEGYLGRDEFPLTGKIVAVDLFSLWKKGGANFENPSINLYVENALGIPLSNDFEEFSITTLENQIIDIESEVISTGIELDYPLLAERGEAKITTFSFDKSNSNIKEIFKERIKQVNYKITAVYNKDNIVNEEQFIGEGGYFSANVNVEIPLEGSINDLELVDTVDLNISSYDEIESGLIKTIFKNQFPLDLQFQAYFINSENIVVDSLYDDYYFLQGAEIDEYGQTMASESVTTTIEISNNKWRRIHQSTRVVLAFRLNTINSANTPLWIYDDYDIFCKMGALLEIKIN